MYSIDFIQRAVDYKNEGHTFVELKNAFNIPPETYYLWKEKLENGYTGEKVFRERKRKIDKELLKQTIADKPELNVIIIRQIVYILKTGLKIIFLKKYLKAIQ